MLAVLQIATVSLVAVAMGLALAHALELPAKCVSTGTHIWQCKPFTIPVSRSAA